MCIRDSPCTIPEAASRDVHGVAHVDGQPERVRVHQHGRRPAQPGCEPPPRRGRGRGSEDQDPEEVELA
eukprot:5222154-Alexandrium_andersonii.AAC.1